MIVTWKASLWSLAACAGNASEGMVVDTGLHHSWKKSRYTAGMSLHFGTFPQLVYLIYQNKTVSIRFPSEENPLPSLTLDSRPSKQVAVVRTCTKINPCMWIKHVKIAACFLSPNYTCYSRSPNWERRLGSYAARQSYLCATLVMDGRGRSLCLCQIYRSFPLYKVGITWLKRRSKATSSWNTWSCGNCVTKLT